MTAPLVVVFGASSRPGLAQLRQLKLRGYRIRAVTRQAGLANPDFMDVELVHGDYNDRDSLQRACESADAAFFTPPAFSELGRTAAQIDNLGRATCAAGIRTMIYNTTSWLPEEPLSVPTLDRGLAQLSGMRATGVPLTVIRPSLFMDNLLTRWVKPDLLVRGEFIYPHREDLEVSWICLDDVARFMIEALERRELHGATLDVGGPEILQPGRVAEILSGVLGNPIRYRRITPREFGERMYSLFRDVAGVDRDAYVAMLQKHYEYKNRHNTFRVDMTELLRRIPIRLTTMAEWAQAQDWRLDSGQQVGSVSG